MLQKLRIIANISPIQFGNTHSYIIRRKTLDIGMCIVHNENAEPKNKKQKINTLNGQGIEIK